MGQAPLLRYRGTIEYDGTDYGGFQVQPGQPTIQGELERILEHLTQAHVRVHGAGRTDAGVHATGQVVHFDAYWTHGCGDLQRAMNALLPGDIAVRALREADQSFHARFSARRRLYVYTVCESPVRAPLWRRFAHHVRACLDVSAMQEAACALVGRQDFAAFGQPPVGTNSVRTVFAAQWREAASERCSATWAPARRLCFEIEADAFLRGMVRRIVGTLLAVGMGSMAPQGFRDVLASRDTGRAAPPAPACGLCLCQVSYAEDAGQTGPTATGPGAA